MTGSPPPVHLPLRAYLLLAGISFAGLLLLRVPVAGWCVGALLLMAFLLVLNALRKREDIHSQESPLRRFFLTLRDMVGGTLVVWVYSLVLIVGLVLVLPGKLLERLKRRLILLFRHFFE